MTDGPGIDVHVHVHGPRRGAGSSRRRLAFSLALTFGVFIVEIVGALLSGSIALLADSAHVLTDATGLTLAVVAATLSGRPATDKRTFGWKRAETLAALANGLLMLGIGVFVIVEGIGRLIVPPDVAPPIMLVAAAMGLGVNLVIMALLARGHRSNLNMRGAYLEVWGDMMGSILVIVAGVVIAITGLGQADGIASIVIGVLILPRALALLARVGNVLLEAVPKSVDTSELKEHLLAIPGVVEVHDLHVWTIASGLPSLTVHAEIDEAYAPDVASGAMLRRFRECTRVHFAVEHCTIQLEMGPPADCVGGPV